MRASKAQATIGSSASQPKQKQGTKSSAMSEAVSIWQAAHPLEAERSLMAPRAMGPHPGA